DAVRRDVLPFRAELSELPVLPRLAAVGVEPPAVADGAVPDLPFGPEGEGVDEVPRDGMSSGIPRRPVLLPPPGSLAVHEDALAVGADPQRRIRRARDRQHVDTP